MAERIPGARLLELPGAPLIPWGRDLKRALDEAEAFLEEAWQSGPWDEPEPERVLATILFTDIVGSTEHAALLGDRAWHELPQRRHELVRRQLVRFRGREVNTAGDGFFACFDLPAWAIRCAQAGARVASYAEPGEVLVSSTVKDLVAGSGLAFQDRGTHELRGVPGEWRLYAVEP
jgi:class 3 adenylate cyclase